VYLAVADDAARSSFTIGGDNVSAHWLIDGDHGGVRNGKVGLIEIASGGSAKLPSDARREEMVFVLRGRGVARAEPLSTEIREGSVVFLSGSVMLDVHAHDDGLRLLLIQGDVAGGGAKTKITHLEQVENVPFHRPELGFLHVAARWLVNSSAVKAQSFVVGQSTFVPGGAHLLHKHHRGDEFFYVFDGRGAHLVEGDELPMGPGDVVFAPRDEWHGFRNTGDRAVRAIFGYFGVASLEEAGYEVHQDGKVDNTA